MLFFYCKTFLRVLFYKIDGNYLSNELGIDLNSINTNNLQLYGNIGGRLPQNTSADQPDDLSEIPIKIEDGGDGNLSSDEYFLFYAEGADRWSYESEEVGYTHQKNVYDFNNYVFLKLNGSGGKRVESINSTGAIDYDSEEFDFLQIYFLAPYATYTSLTLLPFLSLQTYLT